MAVAAHHDARVVALPHNVGPAGARNAGLRHVLTPYVVFVDSDVVVSPRRLSVLLRHFADPLTSLVAPRICGLDGAATGPWLSRYESVRSSLDLGTRQTLVRPGSPVSWVPTACMAARVSALGDGFEAGMRVGEDVDLC
ncbi:glycosyltransferase [Streptomyces sp. BH105]|uniref:glycosyltransferase n=1 Tax=Streptomyces sp. BH105 TaxID=3410408 RepID=UPI003CF6EA14